MYTSVNSVCLNSVYQTQRFKLICFFSSQSARPWHSSADCAGAEIRPRKWFGCREGRSHCAEDRPLVRHVDFVADVARPGIERIEPRIVPSSWIRFICFWISYFRRCFIGKSADFWFFIVNGIYHGWGNHQKEKKYNTSVISSPCIFIYCNDAVTLNYELFPSSQIFDY